ncbi:TPA: RepB family plasmid replication initiator protein [Salmonella enterica subsp. enterica serovar Newport]
MTDNKFIADILYSDLIKKEKSLTVNSNNTVQPVALMRLGIFVPTPPAAKNRNTSIDATELLGNLAIVKAEGYDDIKISGPVLNMDTDFKVWLGVILAFSKYGLSTNKISLKFSEFAKFCGFPAKRIDAERRKIIHVSLGKLRNKAVTFRRGENTLGGYNTGLLKTGGFNAEKDVIELEADEKLWELFQLDYRVLLQLHAIKALPRKEAAQAIYTFIESLPKRPVPVSFARLRERLNLVSPVGEQNRTIKNALAQLQKIGYLDCSVEKKDGENYVIIHSRNPKLKPA